jgi:sec-independent protein translocase protein TatC
MPLMFFMLSFVGMVKANMLVRSWQIAVAGVAVAAALITPTVDPVKMSLVIVPLLALYVLSIGFVIVGSKLSNV